MRCCAQFLCVCLRVAFFLRVAMGQHVRWLANTVAGSDRELSPSKTATYASALAVLGRGYFLATLPIRPGYAYGSATVFRRVSRAPF